MSGDIDCVATVSRETLLRLQTYAELLIRWNQKINLVSPETISDLWRRHIADSIQLAHLAPVETQSWVDLGSGAGLPGLLIATVRQDIAPLEQMVLIDSDSRKSAFMAEASRAMEVPVTIETRRLGGATELRSFDVISARALAPLPKLLDYAEPFISDGTICLFPKGQSRSSEIEAASVTWCMKIEQIASQSGEGGAVLRIAEMSRLAAAR